MLFLLAGLCALARGSQPAVIGYMPIEMSLNDQVVLLTAQGLLNRETARLWLVEPVFWTFAPSTVWFPDNWLGPVKGFVFQNLTQASFCELVDATGLVTRGFVSGIALYNDTALDASRWLAVTAGTLQGLLPLTPEMLSSPTYEPCLGSLPIKFDMSSPKFSSNVAAYQWGRTNLLPLCNQSAIYSAGHNISDATETVYLGSDPAIDIGLDGAVALGMFVFNLSPDCGKYPVHCAEFTALVAALDTDVPSLFGWAEPEPAMTAATSKGGGAVVCDAAPNLSFWLHVASAQPALPYNSDATIALESDHVYISWQTNEGDTPKIAAALQGGLWIDPARGSIPMSWGVNPLLQTFAPGLIEFYALTATANDSFFSATAGAGYAYPWLMPNASFVSYVQRAAGLIDAITPGWPPFSWEIDIWDSNVPENVSSYAAIAGESAGMFTMQPEAMAGSNTVLPGGLPLVITNASLWYPFQNHCPPNPEATMVQTIVDTVAHLPRPAFLVVYGTLYDACNNSMFHYAHAVQQAMAQPSGSTPPVTVVGIQDLTRLARQAAAASSL